MPDPGKEITCLCGSRSFNMHRAWTDHLRSVGLIEEDDIILLCKKCKETFPSRIKRGGEMSIKFILKPDQK